LCTNVTNVEAAAFSSVIHTSNWTKTQANDQMS
jgi:hypothetical protein